MTKKSKQPVYRAKFEVEIELTGTEFDYDKDLKLNTRCVSAEFNTSNEITLRRLFYLGSRIMNGQAFDNTILDLVRESLITLHHGENKSKLRNLIIDQSMSLREKELRGRMFLKHEFPKLYYTDEEVAEMIRIRDDLIAKIRAVMSDLPAGRRVTKTAVAERMFPKLRSTQGETNPTRTLNSYLKKLPISWEDLLRLAKTYT